MPGGGVTVVTPGGVVVPGAGPGGVVRGGLVAAEKEIHGNQCFFLCDIYHKEMCSSVIHFGANRKLS